MKLITVYITLCVITSPMLQFVVECGATSIVRQKNDISKRSRLPEIHKSTYFFGIAEVKNVFFCSLQTKAKILICIL